MRDYKYFLRDGGKRLLYRTKYPKVALGRNDHKRYYFEYLSNVSGQVWLKSDNMRFYQFRKDVTPTTEEEFVMEHL